ncbi:MAG: hemolysin III family protein [Bacteroidales bacterium]|nr:hemolysin III family protein [Bacteroidales bacterium]
MDQRDLISSLTHLLMALWSVFATLFLSWQTRGHGRFRRVAIGYGFSMVFLYLASGVFHGLVYIDLTQGLLSETRDHAVAVFWFFQRLDKSAIFLLIALSNLVIMVYILPHGWRRWCVALMSGFAVLGIFSLWCLPRLPHPLLVGIYLGMGLSGMVPLRVYGRVMHWKGYGWVITFGTLFVSGAIFEVARWPTLIPGYLGPHEMLHILIMGGSFIHFVFVARFIVSQPPRADYPLHPVHNRPGRTHPAQPTRSSVPLMAGGH